MARFHVILADELGDEFSIEVDGLDRNEVWETVEMEYPESSVLSVMALRRYVRED